MSYISWTVFDDAECTKYRSHHELSGDDAERAISAFKRGKGGWDVCEGDVIYGCRIDRVGSEDFSDFPY